MNKNIPHAVKVVRAAMDSSGSDPAAAIAHALNGVGLLVDPERSFGTLLQRRPADGAREHRDHQDQPDLPICAENRARPEPARTDLEAQALAWDQSCERARLVAQSIRRDLGSHPSLMDIRTDGDRILLSLQVLNQSQWAEWQRYFGIRYETETSLPYMAGGDGYRDGVRVSVVAYDLPEARAHALRTARAPFEFEGIIYDLALPQRDAEGDVWYFHGQATNGMPLLSVDGRPERCQLANIIQQKGPLTPVTGHPSPQVAPVMTGVEGGGGA